MLKEDRHFFVLYVNELRILTTFSKIRKNYKLFYNLKFIIFFFFFLSFENK